jgi:hypothetical protein
LPFYYIKNLGLRDDDDDDDDNLPLRGFEQQFLSYSAARLLTILTELSRWPFVQNALFHIKSPHSSHKLRHCHENQNLLLAHSEGKVAKVNLLLSPRQFICQHVVT